jgi:hypothetical protein
VLALAAFGLCLIVSVGFIAWVFFNLYVIYQVSSRA